MQCPKCGREVQPGAFICPGCEFILDTSFLGDDITDDDKEKRVPTKAFAAGGKASSGEFGEDAIILGDGQGEYSDFSSRDAGGLTREVTQARFYIGGATAALLHTDAVPEIAPGIVEGSLRMSPFERHVLSFINGKRSIGRIQKKSGMDDSEFKVSVSMLADKGIIRLRTTKKKKSKSGAGSSTSRSESASI
ncbi:MAG TPA: zinc ribbon domain-containing protein, partial [Myxococcota bacterium]